MWRKLPVSRAAWTVIDQAVVSAGSFIVSIILARGLLPSEYGSYALLLGGLFTLQLFNATLLFHPLSVRMPVTDAADQPALLSATLGLVALLSAGLGVVLALGLTAAGRPELIVPALCLFLAWQTQETLRRGLLTTFRHRTAVLGDATGYLGQAAVVGSLAFTHNLTLEHTLYGMAATSALAGLVQWVQLGWRLRLPQGLRHTVADYWSVGGFWALGNGLLAQGRMQLLLWMLTASAGPAAAASFQAALNIVYLSNPIAIGFGNIIPQVAAKANKDGGAAAWHAVRAYAVLAVILIAGYCMLVLAVPSPILSVLYGAESGYAGLATTLRLLILAGLIGYLTEVVISYLHGISAAPMAFGINLIGTLATVALAIPLVDRFGLEGACLALMGANILRLAAARHALIKATTMQPRLA